MTTVYLLQAEHFSNPGRITTIFASEKSANEEAARLANLMRSDTDFSDMPPECAPYDWSDLIAWLQDVHGAQNCYIEITPQPIVGRLLVVEEA